MIETTLTTDVKRPVHDVFAYLADFSTLPEYDRYVKSVARTSDGPIGVGTTWTHQRVQGRRMFDAPIRLVEFQPDRRFVMVSGSNGFDVRSTVTFEPLDESSTRVVEMLEMKLSGMVRLFEPFIRRQVPKQGHEVHQAFKRILESR